LDFIIIVPSPQHFSLNLFYYYFNVICYHKRGKKKLESREYFSSKIYKVFEVGKLVISDLASPFFDFFSQNMFLRPGAIGPKGSHPSTK